MLNMSRWKDKKEKNFVELKKKKKKKKLFLWEFQISEIC